MAATTEYIITNEDDPLSGIFFIELKENEKLESMVIEALTDQHGGKLGDFDPLYCNGEFRVQWIENTDIEHIYWVMPKNKDNTYQSWGVRHEKQ